VEKGAVIDATGAAPLPGRIFLMSEANGSVLTLGLASQARHDMDAPIETFTSRIVVYQVIPQGIKKRED